MPSYLTGHRLEFSQDPLSEAAPTYEDVTDDLMDIEWWAGTSRELDPPTAGGAVIRLKNNGRRWEPDYAAGEFFPNIDTHRRFRLFLDAGAGDEQQGLWYVTDYEIVYPTGRRYSEVIVTCGDGFEALSQDDLESLDPPTAQTYEDVVMRDGPFGYWTLRDRRGATKAAAAVGPEGTYKARQLLVLGGDGPILGDPESRSVHFDESGALEGHVQVPLASNEWLADGDAITVEFWVKPDDVSTLTNPITGPENTPALTNIFWVAMQNGSVSFSVASGPTQVAVATSANFLLSNGSWSHVVCVAVSGQLRIYINGVLVAVASYSAPLMLPTLNSPLFIGADPVGGDGFTGSLAEVAVYEHGLSADRVLAHWQAGSARGFPEQTAGERVAAVVDSPLWGDARIQTAGLDLQPVMQRGQSRLDEIKAAVEAEGPLSLFFFDGEGQPVYLGWEYKAGGSYNTVQALFGDQEGEVRYRVNGLELKYDNEVFNTIVASHLGGILHTALDADSRADRGRRVHETPELLLINHHDVEAVAGAHLDVFRAPALRPVTLTTTGGQAGALDQIMAREIGDLVRVRRRGEGGTPIDRITHILGYHKTLDASLRLTCTYNLARGFNAGQEVWRLGIAGYSELGETTVLA